MKVKVCDAICGAGKTSSAIAMMNSNSSKRYVFVTPYLSEVDRIQKACSGLHFQAPDDSSAKTKMADLKSLINSGSNIVTTHALFLKCADSTKQMLAEARYTLVLDEVVSTMEEAKISKGDVAILDRAGLILDDESGKRFDWKSYKEKSGAFSKAMALSVSHRLLCFEDNWFFWSVPPSLFTCFEDVYLMTYLFEYQPIRYFFDANKIEYELIGTRRTETGFEFCPRVESDRARDLRGMIHILDNKKLNKIGDGRTDLSHAWFQRSSSGKDAQASNLERLRKNIGNIFKNVWKAESQSTMWGVYKEYQGRLKGWGYAKSFVSYNIRASNDYSGRTFLAYCVNVFFNPFEKRYYKNLGVKVDDDMYAVSTMVQWIFRSAIRNNKEIWIYIPSARMRWLLAKWLDNLAAGEDLKPISYVQPKKKPTSAKKKEVKK